MFKTISCSNFIFHPFSGKNGIKLNSTEKAICYTGLALGALFVLPAVPVFYGLSYYFKSKKVKILKTNKKIDNSLSTSTFSVIKKKSKKNEPPAQDLPSFFPKKAIQSNKTPEGLTALEVRKHIDELIADGKTSNKKKFFARLLQSNPQQFYDLLYDLTSVRDEEGVAECLAAFDEQNLEAFFQSDKELFSEILKNILEIGDLNLTRMFILVLLNNDSLEEFLDSYADVTLLFDQQEVKMPKAFLTTVLPFFNNSCYAGYAEADKNEIKMSIKEDTFWELMYFRLGEEIEITDDNLPELFDIAERFALPDLREACQATEITAANFQMLLDLAERYIVSELRDKCEEWIINHIADFENQSDLMNLAEHYELTRIPSFLYEDLILRYLCNGNSKQDKALLKSWGAKLTVLKLPKVEFGQVAFLAKYLSNVRYVHLMTLDNGAIDFLLTLKHLQVLVIKDYDGYLEVAKLNKLFMHFEEGPMELDEFDLASYSILSSRHLNLKDCHVFESKDSVLPDHLETLAMPWDFTYPKSGFNFPSSLKNLDISFFFHPRNLPQLPQGLEQLTMSHLEANNLPKLPSSLKKLTLNRCKCEFWSFPDTIESIKLGYISITDQLLAGLALKSLKKLSLVKCTKAPSSTGKLPISVTSFKINGKKCDVEKAEKYWSYKIKVK